MTEPIVKCNSGPHCRLMHLLLALLLFIPRPGIGAQEPGHWESMVALGDTCRYLVPDGAVDPDWTGKEFDDSAWKKGPGGVGYGDGDDATTIDPAISVYCRYRIAVPDPAVFSDLLLDIDFDDGFVAYLNGAEIARYHMGQAGSPTSWSTPADGLHEALRYRNISPMRFLLGDLLPGILDTGTNILAVEVHNHSVTSSDLSSNAYLHAFLNTSDTLYSPTPDWFMPPFSRDSTHLPLMLIDTEGREIPNEPRIVARMGLIDNGEGEYQSVDDPYNVYDGRISIELRGESSLYFYPKHSYSIETQLENGENNNVSLLGLPVENDYVLYAPYGDKSLIRNVISYGLFERMGHYAPRTRFIELVVNGDYRGVYVLTEKIKRDRNRVDMARLKPEDVSGEELTGGYLLRIDKLTGMGPAEYWESTVQPPLDGYHKVIYQYFDPDYDELVVAQKAYIRDYMGAFEEVLDSPGFKDPNTGYRAYLDIPSFVDLMILNEFTKDVDGFRLSHYFYKQKVTNGGKVVNGPPWDYNLTFGNSDFTEDVHATYNWVYTKHNTIYWWARVMQDPWFQNRLCCRWDELYGTILSRESVNEMIDSTLEVLDDAVFRNYDRWPALGEYVWPNSFVGGTYDEEIGFLKDWIGERLAWIDERWGGQCIPSPSDDNDTIPQQPEMLAYPNPSDLSRLFVALPFSPGDGITLTLFDLNGRVVYRSGRMQAGPGQTVLSLPDLSPLPAGMYTLYYADDLHNTGRCKVIRR